MLSYAAFGISPANFDPERTFVQSSLVSPFVLASIRAFISFYCFVTIIFAYSWQACHTVSTDLRDVNISTYWLTTSGPSAIGQSFSFFTWLTFWSLGFYFLVSSTHTFYFARHRWTWLHNSWPKQLQFLHSIFYTTITCFPFLVTITFWATMYGRIWPPSRYDQWANVSVHGLNSLFAITEIILPATKPFPWTHLPILLLILSLYLGLAYLTRYTQGIYVYAWLDPAFGKWSILLHIISYTGAIMAIFATVRGCIWLRNYLLVKVEGGETHLDILPEGQDRVLADEEALWKMKAQSQSSLSSGAISGQ